MKLKMAEKSLFAYLLRSPWWVSILAACGIGLLGKIMFRGDYFSYALLQSGSFYAAEKRCGGCWDSGRRYPRYPALYQRRFWK